MNKTEFIKLMAQKADLSTKEADRALKAFQECVVEVLKNDDKINFAGFGTFHTTIRKERNGINPATKETIVIPEAKVAKMKFSKNILD